MNRKQTNKLWLRDKVSNFGVDPFFYRNNLNKCEGGEEPNRLINKTVTVPCVHVNTRSYVVVSRNFQVFCSTKVLTGPVPFVILFAALLANYSYLV